MGKQFTAGEDTIQIVIAENGEIIMESAGSISKRNHQSADEFLRETAEMAGGEVTRTKLKKTHTHDHLGVRSKQRA